VTVLDRIVERARGDLAGRMERLPLAELERRVRPSDRDFHRELAAPGLRLIAEFKPRSPSRGELQVGADPRRYARAYEGRAAAISVLTEGPHFGGHHGLLEVFREESSRPLLCKDFLVHPYQILEARCHGADAVLLLASLHEAPALRELLALARGLRMEALVEAHDAREIDRALEAGARVVGVNARDLRTLRIDPEATLPLLERIPRSALRVAESGVSRREQVEALRGVADAVLIGSALMEASAPEQALERLGW